MKLIEQMRVLGETSSSNTEISPQNRIVFRTNTSESGRMFGKEMVNEDRSCRCCIVTGKDEQLNLTKCKILERGIHSGGRLVRGVFGLIGFQSKINDRLALGFFLNGIISVIELAGDVTVHPACVVPMNNWTNHVDILQRIDLDTICTPAELIAECRGHVVVTGLAVEFMIPDDGC